MQILVTNDDGIFAPGIQQLAQKMAKLGEVIVAAPTEEKSAIGHGITLRNPIGIRKVTVPGIEQAWAVGGTPADCVKLAVKEFAHGNCDLVISGINNGPNLGTDVLYSGTVSAAIEGAILGIPSLAVSLASHESDDYTVAAEVTYQMVKKLQSNLEYLPRNTLLNMNVPAISKQEIKGIKITRLGIREYENLFDKRKDPRGNVYYWLIGRLIPHRHEEPDIDIVAVENNYVSLTPIHFDLTNYSMIEEMKEWDMEKINLF